MMLGGVAQALWGVKAEGRSLEDIARPLTAQAAGEEQPATRRRRPRPGGPGVQVS
jgi:hypothetical protein